MVVAAGTGDRQPQQPARDDVNPIVDDVRLIVQETPAEGEETQSGEGPFVFAKVQLVGGELLEDKPIKRQVVIESADDVVAVGVGISVAAFLLEDVALG